MTNKLLRCPFCGEDKATKEADDEYTKYIMCIHCESKGASCENWYGAVEYWNTRASDKSSIDYIQGFLEAKKQMIRIIENLPDKD